MDTRTDELLFKILEQLTPKEVFAVFGSSTTTGSVSAGCLKVSFINSGGANATVTSGGTSYTLEPDEIIILDPGIGRRNGLITFTATGTTLKYIIYR